MYKINHANIKEWAKNYDGPLFDGILCDPPYHLTSMSRPRTDLEDYDNGKGNPFARRQAAMKGFMGKEWDGVDENGIGIAQDPEMWALLYKLLKPGAHLLAFSGSRTYHRMAVAIEDAGFEIRDMIEWVYGSGFPKSLNIGKAVDKIQGNEREVVGKIAQPGSTNKRLAMGNGWQDEPDLTKGTSEWEGYGTALKPAHEPCVLARKPLDGTVANNVLKHGTGGLNIDGTRIPTAENRSRDNSKCKPDSFFSGKQRINQVIDNTGRFPANLIHDGSDEVEAVFPQTKSGGGVKLTGKGSNNNVKFQNNTIVGDSWQASSGSASRFFYTAKASKSERNAGLEGFEKKESPKFSGGEETREGKPSLRPMFQNFHPTVKPLSLTKYLATLIKPPTGGRLLVPFSGSGSEMIGGLQAGWEYVEGVELTEEYIPIAEARIKYWTSIKEEESKQVSLL